MTLNYTYDGTSKLITSIAFSNADGNNSTYTYTYDTYKRPLSVIETNPYASFTKRFTYDGFGRIYTEENQANAYGKSSVKKVKNTYQNGGLISVSDFTTSEVLWVLNAMNSRGQVTLSTVGNNLKKINTYNTYGYLTQSKAEKSSGTTTTQLMQLSYNFNAQRGTLTSRTNSLFTWNESFTYDSQDRLLAFNDNNSQNSHTYDARGRIVSNSKLGNYVYSTTSYQQTELSLNTSGQAYFSNYQKQQITYNSFKNPVEITEEGKDKVSFEYNAFMGRSNMFYGGLETNKTLRKHRKHYSHDGSMEVAYEKTTGKVTFVSYLMGDAYSSPVIWHSEHSGSVIANNYYYLHRDYLGSILAITDKEGVFKEKRHFDAWGNIVKLQDGAGNNLTAFKILDRGYTGHEHLLGVGIIHMNGRLYDPVLHRFLSPDNFVQDPFNSQNFNRYAYVLNNPLMYTDPSGEIIPFVIIGAAVIGAYIGGSMANGTWNPTKWNWKSGDTWLGIVGGGALGAGSAFVGAGIATSLAAKGLSSAFWATAIGSTVGGGIQGGGFSLLPGGDGKFLKGVGIGAFSGFVGGSAGYFASQNIANVMINGISISSPVVKGAVGGFFGGAAGGYAGGFAGGYLATGDLNLAHNSGVQGATMGAGVGTVMGAATAYSMAKSQGMDPLTGKYKDRAVIGENMNSRVGPASNDFGADPIEFGDTPAYLDRALKLPPTPEGLDLNAKWIQSKIDSGVHIYDIGPNGTTIRSSYYNLEVGRTWGYQNLHNSTYRGFFPNHQGVPRFRLISF